MVTSAAAVLNKGAEKVLGYPLEPPSENWSRPWGESETCQRVPTAVEPGPPAASVVILAHKRGFSKFQNAGIERFRLRIYSDARQRGLRPETTVQVAEVGRIWRDPATFPTTIGIILSQNSEKQAERVGRRPR
jgi:hypothetical protein